MEFSAFIKRLSKNVITLSNSNPISNVKTVLSYEEVSNGAFLSKLFRWSEDKSTWTDWTILTQESIRTIQPTTSPNNVYLQFKYTKHTANAGDVYKITLNYSDVVVSDDADTSPPGFTPIPTPTVTQPSQLTDANLLNGQNGAYYLNRVNHTGSQPISSIEGLSRQLYNLSHGIQQANQYYDFFVGWNNNQDASIIKLEGQVLVIDNSISYLSNYDAIQDVSIALASASGSNAWNGLTKTDNSIGLGGPLVKENTIDLNDYNLIFTSSGLGGKLKYGDDYGATIVEDRWIPDWGWVQNYVDASVNAASGLWTQDASNIYYEQGGVIIGRSTPLGNDGFAGDAILTIEASAGPGVPRERLLHAQVADSSNYFSVINTTSAPGRFVPTFVGYAPDTPSTVQALSFDGRIPLSEDIASPAPIIQFRVQQLDGISEITNRAIAGFGSGAAGNDMKMVVMAGGEVGIGTTEPSALLTIVNESSPKPEVEVIAPKSLFRLIGGGGSEDYSAQQLYNNTGTLDRIDFVNFSTTYTGTYAGRNYANLGRFVKFGNGDFILGTDGTGDLAFVTAGVETMTLNQLGRVGIGTPNPSQTFTVAAPLVSALFGQDNSAGLNHIGVGWASAADAAFFMSYDGVNNVGGLTVGGDVLGDSLTVKRGGAVGIGTLEPSTKFHVHDDTTGINWMSTLSGPAGRIRYASDDTNERMIFVIDNDGTPTPGRGVFATSILGNTFGNFSFDAYGSMLWGAGTTDYDTNLYRQAAATLQTDGSLIISSNVGIGTQSPSTTLDVSGYINLGLGNAQSYNISNAQGRFTIEGKQSGEPGSMWFFANDGDGTDNVAITTFGKGTLDSFASEGHMLVSGYLSAPSEYRIYTSHTGTGEALPLNISASDNYNQLYLSTQGNVGIGTPSPNYTLDVSGNVNSTGGYYINGVPFSPGDASIVQNASDIADVSARVDTIESNTIDLFDISTGVQALLSDAGNWNQGAPDFGYSGTAITGTYQGQQFYDASFYFVAVQDDVWIRLMRG